MKLGGFIKTEVSDGHSTTLRPDIFWGLCVALSLCGIIPFLRYHSISVDLAESIYHARALLAGRAPYSEMVTHHFLGYVLPLLVVGKFTALTQQVIWLIAWTLNVLSAVLLSRLVLIVSKSAEASRIAALLVVTAGWLWGWGGVTVNVQCLFMPLLLLYLLAIVGTTIVDSGILAGPLSLAAFIFGVLVCCDQRLLVFGLLFAIPLLRKSGNAQELLWALVVPSILLVSLALYSSLADFIDQTIRYPLVHRNLGLTPSPIENGFALVKGGFGSEPIVVCIALLSFIAFVFRERRREIRHFILVTGLAAALYALSGGRPYAHYLLPLSPIVFLLISLLPGYLSGTDPRLLLAARTAIYFLIIGSVAKPLFLYAESGSLYFDPAEAVDNAVVTLVQSTAQGNTDLFVWGYAPQLYNRTDQLACFRDMGLLSITGANFDSGDRAAQGIVPAMEAEFKQVMRNTPPRIIVIHTTTARACGRTEKVCPQKNMDFRQNTHLAYFKQLLEDRYQLLTKYSSELDGAEVYLRREADVVQQ